MNDFTLEQIQEIVHKLERSQLSGANLSGANLIRANLFGALMNGANKVTWGHLVNHLYQQRRENRLLSLEYLPPSHESLAVTRVPCRQH